MPRKLVSRFQAWLKSDRLNSEFSDELETHIALLQERFERQGMNPDDAYYAAERQLGGVTRVKENVHERRTLPLLETVCQDAKDAIRQFRKSPAISDIRTMDQVANETLSLKNFLTILLTSFAGLLFFLLLSVSTA